MPVTPRPPLQPQRPARSWLRTRSSRVSATRSVVDFTLLQAHSQSMDVTEQQQSELSFEAALARLEEIVRLLERGEAPLDQSIELYQEGDRLRKHCEARLKAAQARIEQIAFGSDGKPAGLKPFDAG